MRGFVPTVAVRLPCLGEGHGRHAGVPHVVDQVDEKSVLLGVVVIAPGMQHPDEHAPRFDRFVHDAAIAVERAHSLFEKRTERVSWHLCPKEGATSHTASHHARTVAQIGHGAFDGDPVLAVGVHVVPGGPALISHPVHALADFPGHISGS